MKVDALLSIQRDPVITGIDVINNFKIQTAVGKFNEMTAIETDMIFRTNDGSDNAAPTEAFRVDSSQHLLVGKTSPSGSTVGAELRSGGTVIATVDSDYPLYLNRLSNSGDIVQFRKT